MDDDPMEGTSELFASVLSDVTPEEWENYKQMNKYGNYIVDSASDDDSCMSDRSVSPCREEMIANVELVEDEEADEVASEASDDEENDGGQTAWGCDAAVKYVNGEITFSELNDIMENKKPKCRPRKRRRTEKELKEPRQESQIEKEHREYEMELKNKKKRGRRKRGHLPKELEGLMGAAHVKFAQGETEDAIKMCMELIRLAPTAQEPFQTLGVIYDAIREPRKSLQCYLVAACLDPSDTEEWIRLADLSLEQNKIAQAISCYSYAIRNEPDNVPFLWERCNLYERIGDRKKALAGYEQILKHLSAPEAGQKCVEMSREIAKVHYENTDYINAIKVLEMAFTKFPSLITSEDVNFLLELQLIQKFYTSAIKNFVQHCGVKLQMPDREIDTPDELETFTDDDFKVVLNCYVPEVLPVDLAVKVLLCLIHLQSLTAVQPLLEALTQENPEDFGDLYLDVAEAFMEIKEYEFAKTLLSKLLKTDNYNLPAVWMKYADCLHALSHVEEAMTAYQKVIEMAPTYQEARLALSNILLKKGKIADAASILKQEYEEGKEVTTLGTDALYQRCRLLQAEKRWDEFIQAAVLLQYSHCYLLETEEEYSDVVLKDYQKVFFEVNSEMQNNSIQTGSVPIECSVMANQTSKRRNEALRDLKAQSKKLAPEFIGSKISLSDMWDIFKVVSNKLLEQKRFEELQCLSLAALTSTMFMKNPEMAKDCEFQALLSCFFNNSHYYAYLLVKDLVIKNINNKKAWNLFCLIITRSQESRHNRFCLRLMMKHQDHLALGFLNGHNAMISGTYKHALGEYMCILKERPNDPFATFCVGYTFIHMACQKFATKRHFLALQGFVFLSHYLKLKGECQEAYYNIGRALHQLGMKDMAIQYYKKALCAPVVIKGPDEEVFNLKREIAYNLSLIYQATGALDLAYMYSRKYIVV